MLIEVVRVGEGAAEGGKVKDTITSVPGEGRVKSTFVYTRGKLRQIRLSVIMENAGAEGGTPASG